MPLPATQTKVQCCSFFSYRASATSTCIHRCTAQHAFNAGITAGLLKHMAVVSVFIALQSSQLTLSLRGTMRGVLTLAITLQVVALSSSGGCYQVAMLSQLESCMLYLRMKPGMMQMLNLTGITTYRIVPALHDAVRRAC